jgi:hypothetical protein
VDGSVPAANLTNSAGQGAAGGLANSVSFDLNALPATAAGPAEMLGFPVTRLATNEVAAMQVGDASDGMTLGGHRLFVFHGIPAMQLTSDGIGSLRVPEDAFAHTDPSAVVHLDARLVNGLPLPSWLTFEGTRGVFSGTPPDGLRGTVEIEVVARDTEGREARTKFVLLVEDLRADDGTQSPDSANPLLGLDVDKKEAEKARVEAGRPVGEGRATGKPRTGTDGKPQKTPAASFSEQVRAAKATRDPLLDRIAKTDPDGKPGPRR